MKFKYLLITLAALLLLGVFTSTALFVGNVSKLGVNQLSQMKKKVEPDPTLCFNGFNQKTKEQGEDHDSTEEKER